MRASPARAATAQRKTARAPTPQCTQARLGSAKRGTTGGRRGRGAAPSPCRSRPATANDQRDRGPDRPEVGRGAPLPEGDRGPDQRAHQEDAQRTADARPTGPRRPPGAGTGCASLPPRGRRRPPGLRRGQVRGQRRQLAQRLGRVRRGDPLVQLADVQPALGEGRVELRDHTLPVGVAGPQRSVVRRAHARSSDRPAGGGANRSALVAARTRCAPALLSRLRQLHAELGELREPPSSAVSTQTPSSMRATVCSTCAATEPSGVTTVQPSASSPVPGRAHGDHRLDGQRHARHQPRAPARPAVVEHVRVLVHLGADAVAAVAVDDAVRPGLRADRLSRPRAQMSVSRPPADAPAAATRPTATSSATSISSRQLRPDLADRDGDRRVAVPAVERSRRSRARSGRPRAAPALGRRDAVHDLLVDRGADRAGKPW